MEEKDFVISFIIAVVLLGSVWAAGYSYGIHMMGMKIAEYNKFGED